MQLAGLSSDGRHFALGRVIEVRLHHVVFPVHLHLGAERVCEGESATQVSTGGKATVSVINIHTELGNGVFRLCATHILERLFSPTHK